MGTAETEAFAGVDGIWVVDVLESKKIGQKV